MNKWLRPELEEYLAVNMGVTDEEMTSLTVPQLKELVKADMEG